MSSTEDDSHPGQAHELMSIRGRGGLPYIYTCIYKQSNLNCQMKDKLAECVTVAATTA